jgi:hypothetical protein
MRRSIHSILSVAALLAASVSMPAQDPLKLYPANYRLALDNADVRVVKVHYGPHEKLGMHNHSQFPTIYVYLNDSGSVRFSHDEIPAFIMTRPPVTKGSFRVSPGRVEKHEVENLDDKPSDYLRIELKKLPLNGTLHPVRGAAPAHLEQGDKEEFSSPELSIHRIVCSVGAPCASSIRTPTLLIAFSSLKLTEPGTHLEKQMQSGDIQWQADAAALSITASTPAPAHLLEISFDPQSK